MASPQTWSVVDVVNVEVVVVVAVLVVEVDDEVDTNDTVEVVSLNAGGYWKPSALKPSVGRVTETTPPSPRLLSKMQRCA